MHIKRLILASSLILGLSAGANAAVIMTDFGSVSYTIFDDNFTTASQTTNSLNIVGTDFATFVGGTFSPVDISAELGIRIEGTAATNPTSAFTLEVFDSGGDGAVFSGGSWNDLSSTGETFLTFTSGIADLSDIIALQVNNAGGGAAMDVTLTGATATAIPEPTTSLLALIGVVGLLRRRR